MQRIDRIVIEGISANPGYSPKSVARYLAANGVEVDAFAHGLIQARYLQHIFSLGYERKIIQHRLIKHTDGHVVRAVLSNAMPLCFPIDEKGKFVDMEPSVDDPMIGYSYTYVPKIKQHFLARHLLHQHNSQSDEYIVRAILMRVDADSIDSQVSKWYILCPQSDHGMQIQAGLKLSDRRSVRYNGTVKRYPFEMHVHNVHTDYWVRYGEDNRMKHVRRIQHKGQASHSHEEHFDRHSRMGRMQREFAIELEKVLPGSFSRPINREKTLDALMGDTPRIELAFS